MFKVGDRVKVYREDENMTGGWISDLKKWIGKVLTISSYDSFNDIYRVKENCWRWGGSVLRKVGRHTMNKYDNLKLRIEQVTGWDKEADDIIQEIKYNGRLMIDSNCDGQCGRILIISHGKRPCIEGVGKYDVHKHFDYHSQCEKLSAFKGALMWLLDHSDIKEKTIVGTEQRVEIEGKVYKAKILREESYV